MNNKDLTFKLSKQMGQPLQETHDLLDKTCELLGKKFAEMNSISVKGFGTFEVKKKQERFTNHPLSGKRMLIPPKLILSFAAGKSFKVKLKQQPHEQ